MARPQRHRRQDMDDTTRLQPSQLCQYCDPAQFTFATTGELDDRAEVLGQDRAQEAIEFGLGIRHGGYNLYVLGPSGAGKQTLVRQTLAGQVAAAPAPPDWCYVHNFDAPHQPRALRLPAGRGASLRDDMRHLVAELLAAVPAAFDSDEYRAHRDQIDAEFGERQEEAFGELAQAAGTQEVALLRTPTGFTLAPVRNGEVVGQEEFAALPEDERKRSVGATVIAIDAVAAGAATDPRR
jgi:hypothetical protein